jgi:hypothetical protein
MHTITFAAHVAYLDPMTGEGLLVRPHPADDLSLSGMASLHAADWDHVIAELDRLGWEPLESEEADGTPMFAGMTTDGREVIALYGCEPVTSIPSIMELGEAGTELASMADVIPGSWQA